MSGSTNEPINEDEFVENLEPLTTDTPVATSKPSHNQKVQSKLGLAIVVAALVGYLVVIAFYLLDLTEPSGDMKDLAIFSLSGLQTLAAAVVGFYFGFKKGEE